MKVDFARTKYPFAFFFLCLCLICVYVPFLCTTPLKDTIDHPPTHNITVSSPILPTPLAPHVPHLRLFSPRSPLPYLHQKLCLSIQKSVFLFKDVFFSLPSLFPDSSLLPSDFVDYFVKKINDICSSFPHPPADTTCPVSTSSSPTSFSPLFPTTPVSLLPFLSKTLAVFTQLSAYFH